MAISEQALAALEKENPELVAQYRAKMSGANGDVQSAQDMQDYGSIANVAGKALTDFGNSRSGQSDVILHNSMQNLGRAPGVEKAQHSTYDGSAVTEATGRNLSRAKDAQGKAEGEFWNEQKLTDMSQSRDDASKARAAQARRDDPMSEESKAARAYLKQVAPNAASIPGFESMSAAQAEKAAPGLMERYKSDQQASQHKDDMNQRSADRRAAADERRADREAMAGVRREDKADERAYKDGVTAKANTEKKTTLLNEIEDRRTNINQNLDVLDKMIQENGTWELTGSHNQDMDRLVDAIATDMAKLQDPSSVARPSEVEAVKANLVKSGFGNQNATAQDIIKNFKTEVERRADGAYKIRGIDKPGAKAAPAGGFHGSDLPD
jgi:hypothetical protein